MKLLISAAAVAVVAALFPSIVSGLTEGEQARIAQDKPSRTETYIRKMQLVLNGTSAEPGPNRSVWTVNADSSQSGHPPQYVIDNNASTFWESEETPVTRQYPHNLTIDMKQDHYVTGVTYLPRQDGQLNGTVGRHFIELSTDGINWGQPVAFATWYDDSELKTANFTTTLARYLRLRALSESGNRVPFSSVADIDIFTVPCYTAPNQAVQGAFGSSIDFPTIMVAAAVLPTTGKVLAWSSWQFDAFLEGHSAGLTYTTTYNPATQSVSERIVNRTDHDMFCPGLSRDAQGRPVVTGGNNAYKTSRYDPTTDSWTALATMKVARGYQGQTTLSDGRIFTIGGSFSGGQFLKNGEVYDPETNTWTYLPGCLVQPMLTADTAGLYRADNHGWLFGWHNGSVFQAGPSKNMNWYSTRGNGTQTAAGTRGNDTDAMNGNAVMYDATQGLILAVGGAPDYDNATATPNAHIIQIRDSGTPPIVTRINNMHYPRAFANSVILPDGDVLILGGQTYAQTFTDTNAVLIPEIWDLATQHFTPAASLASIRTYHSTALLLPDASVIVGGGGLCGNCTVNHFDAQIYYPPYFYNSSSGGAPSTRPVIESVSATTLAAGAILTVNVDMPVDALTLMRYGSATHALDTDQRRVPLVMLESSGTQYVVQIPEDTGVVIPGAWMLFALAGGVPSVAATVMVTN